MFSYKIDYKNLKCELCEIGAKYNTDKSSQRININNGHCHPYTLFYHSLFKNKKDSELNIAELENGRKVKKVMEVVLGNTVSKQLNLKIGDTFLSSHGYVENDIDVHSDKFTVVGILKPTQKVIDRLIIANLESFWKLHNHEGKDEDESHTEDHQKAHQEES